jgi:hypothetical protein
MRLPGYRATTANLQAVYPFIVESGLGSDGVYIGRETGSGASFVYDPVFSDAGRYLRPLPAFDCGRLFYA